MIRVALAILLLCCSVEAGGVRSSRPQSTTEKIARFNTWCKDTWCEGDYAFEFKSVRFDGAMMFVGVVMRDKTLSNHEPFLAKKNSSYWSVRIDSMTTESLLLLRVQCGSELFEFKQMNQALTWAESEIDKRRH